MTNEEISNIPIQEIGVILTVDIDEHKNVLTDISQFTKEQQELIRLKCWMSTGEYKRVCMFVQKETQALSDPFEWQDENGNRFLVGRGSDGNFLKSRLGNM